MNQRAFVTGIGIVSPLGLDAPSTWEAAVAGRSGVGRITSFDTTGFDTQIAAEVRGFDPFVYLDRKEARRFDRFSQFAVVATQEAIRHAGLNPADVDPYSVAVLLGTGVGGTTSLAAQLDLLKVKGPGKVSPFLGVHMLSDMASAIVSMHFGFKGLSCALVSACSSGADALGAALRMIRSGEVDIVISGGTEAAICPLSVASFGIMGALSRRNDDPPAASRPFDLHRDGFVIGEGAAILVLESERSVKARCARPLVEFAGYGATSDAYHVSAPDPEGSGARRAVSRALADARIQNVDVDYINAHGTSTPLNDKTETLAIKGVFEDYARHVAISSTKSMTGHLLGAAGALEAAFCVQAVLAGTIPPTINLSNPDPECDLDYTPVTARRHPVTVAVSNSFGFGGHNAVLVFRAVEGREF
ncbi:MAG: beta-ketoacyl-ACP synthase II [Candidatus Eisenbacteria bacterium]|jgi:beta-ketoacyl-acyl-carrier-protein synthase II|nr:beta-ketoacyl-ACP synthase II [Candidatus Eisenbacteria bacterium]